MADNFSVNRGIEANISKQPRQPGAMWVSEDKQTIYFDSKDGITRVQITDIIDLDNNSVSGYFPNKIYIQGNQLKKYDKAKNDLVVISSLESDIIEDNDTAFNYTSQTEATLANTSKPLKGTIVIDKNGDVGVTTSSSATTITVAVIANNSFKNVLIGYDIYFDSNYTGQQIGTFEYPFSTWSELYRNCETVLKGTGLTTIHIKSNSELKINDVSESIKNTVFTGHGTEKVRFKKYNNVKNWSNVIFNQVRTSTFVEGVE